MAEPESTVLLDIDGAIATVTMNRPERRNSIAGTMMAEMNRTLTILASRDDVRIVVLRGAGRDFCPGADINATASGRNAGSTREPLRFDTPVLLHNMPAVTIAAIDGACAGAGFGWACACDMRIATPSAKFNTAFLDVGVAGDMGGPWTLPRLVGAAKARELYFMPGKFDAEKALEIGLVSRVIPEAEFDAEIASIAKRLASAAPLALKAMKANFLAAERMGFADYIDLESRVHVDLFKTDDTREAFRAKAEKRAPLYKGR